MELSEYHIPGFGFNDLFPVSFSAAIEADSCETGTKLAHEIVPLVAEKAVFTGLEGGCMMLKEETEFLGRFD
jgi:hypothetical protein